MRNLFAIIGFVFLSISLNAQNESFFVFKNGDKLDVEEIYFTRQVFNNSYSINISYLPKGGDKKVYMKNKDIWDIGYLKQAGKLYFRFNKEFMNILGYNKRHIIVENLEAAPNKRIQIYDRGPLVEMYNAKGIKALKKMMFQGGEKKMLKQISELKEFTKIGKELENKLKKYTKLNLRMALEPLDISMINCDGSSDLTKELPHY